jgi:hypothetical protein
VPILADVEELVDPAAAMEVDDYERAQLEPDHRKVLAS